MKDFLRPVKAAHLRQVVPSMVIRLGKLCELLIAGGTTNGVLYPAKFQAALGIPATNSEIFKIPWSFQVFGHGGSENLNISRGSRDVRVCRRTGCGHGVRGAKWRHQHHGDQPEGDQLRVRLPRGGRSCVGQEPNMLGERPEVLSIDFGKPYFLRILSSCWP